MNFSYNIEPNLWPQKKLYHTDSGSLNDSRCNVKFVSCTLQFLFLSDIETMELFVIPKECYRLVQSSSRLAAVASTPAREGFTDTSFSAVTGSRETTLRWHLMSRPYLEGENNRHTEVLALPIFPDPIDWLMWTDGCSSLFLHDSKPINWVLSLSPPCPAIITHPTSLCPTPWAR